MGGSAGSLAGRPSGYDGVVVGAGPNGLAAAITLAREGLSVLVREADEEVGGGVRSAELTLPGFVHDVCSAIYPLAVGSPFLRTLPLAAHGLEFVHPQVPLAHPFDDGTAAVLERSVEETAAGLGEDAEQYLDLFAPLVRDWSRLEDAVLGPLLRLPRHPLALARFGLDAIRSARGLAEAVFEGERARALFAGAAAHSFLPLERSPSAAFGLVLLALGHVHGWPVARGGAQTLSDALASHLRSVGGEIVTGEPVSSLENLPPARAVLCDLTPRQLLAVAGSQFSERYHRSLARYRYGPGAFKVDYALDGRVPWTAPACARAGTVHLGGTVAEIAESERAAWEGRHAERPFVIVGQQSLFDETRAPSGKHTLWAYCHVPNGSDFVMAERIEAQIERFAPGFRDLVLDRAVSPPSELERRNRNLVGGDINGGASDLAQVVARPALRLVPYATPVDGLFVCSSSTPPGGGVHGMCGYLAARAALKTLGDRARRA